MKHSYRSENEIFSDILRAIDNGEATISEIQSKTYVSYPSMKKYLTILVQHDLIAYSREEKRFRLTQRGIHVLDTYAMMDELLVRKTTHKVTKEPYYFVSFP